MNTRFDEIENRIKELLASYLESSGHPELEKHGQITGATNLASDFTLDSFQIMEFLMEMEESFDIMIDVNNLSNAHTVKELAKVVDSLLEN